MSSTESAPAVPEKLKLLEIATVHQREGRCRAVLSEPAAGATSYFCDRSELPLLEAPLADYDFNVPAELRAQLERMWDHQGCPHMRAYAVVAAIAAFRYKSEKQVETGIPVFIYQF